MVDSISLDVGLAEVKSSISLFQYRKKQSIKDIDRTENRSRRLNVTGKGFVLGNPIVGYSAGALARLEPSYLRNRPVHVMKPESRPGHNPRSPVLRRRALSAWASARESGVSADDYQIARQTFWQLGYNRQPHCFERYGPGMNGRTAKGDPNRTLATGATNSNASRLMVETGPYNRSLDKGRFDNFRATLSNQLGAGSGGLYQSVAYIEQTCQIVKHGTFDEMWGDAVTGRHAFNTASPGGTNNAVYLHRDVTNSNWASYYVERPNRMGLLRNVTDPLIGRTLSVARIGWSTAGIKECRERTLTATTQARTRNIYDHLIVSGGFRRDQVKQDQVRPKWDPTTNVIALADDETDSLAGTSYSRRTNAVTQLSALGNYADNVQAVGGARGYIMPPSGEPGALLTAEAPKGFGGDVGLGLRLFDGRLAARAVCFETQSKNDSTTFSTETTDTNTRILDALRSDGRITQAQFNKRTTVVGIGLFDFVSTGNEFEITANPSKLLRRQTSHSLSDPVQSNTYSEWLGWDAQNLGDAGLTVKRQVVQVPSTWQFSIKLYFQPVMSSLRFLLRSLSSGPAIARKDGLPPVGGPLPQPRLVSALFFPLVEEPSVSEPTQSWQRNPVRRCPLRRVPAIAFLGLSLLWLAILAWPLVAAEKPPLSEDDRRAARYDRELQAFAVSDREHPPAKGGILFVGSSIFRRWETLAAQMAPLPVLNRAFGGSRTGDQLARFEQIVLPYAPKVIVYYGGSNDINAGQTAPQIAANFRMFAERVHAGLPRTRLLYASIIRAPQKQERWDVVDATNALIRDYCATDPRRGFIDINPAVFDQDGRPRLELYLEDKLHYVPSAYDGFAAIIKPVLERVWRETTAGTASGSAEADTGDTGRVAPPGKPYVYKSAGGEPQKLEVYFPKDHDPAKDRRPALLLFHGGGWSRGSLAQFRAACAYFASRGLVTATADYRMHKKEDVPGLPAGESYKRICVTDAKSAIRWMKQHAAELGVDPRRLITGGGSAGGHLAVLATANRRGLNDPTDPSGFDTTVMAHLLFNPAFTVKDADAEINVLKHLDRGLPPTVVFFGSEDRWKSAWDETQRRLKALGHTTTVQWVAPGQTHGFYLKAPWEDATLVAADRFLARLGCLQGEPTLAIVATAGEVLQRDTAAAPEGIAPAVKPDRIP